MMGQDILVPFLTSAEGGEGEVWSRESRGGPAGEGTGRREGIWELREEKLEEGRRLLGKDGK